MSWELSVVCKSSEKRDKMLEFLTENFTPTSILHGWARKPNFPYAVGELRIEFRNPSEYETAVLRWVALKIGKRRRFSKKCVRTPAPWISCQPGCDPVLPKEDWDGSKDCAHWVADSLGYYLKGEIESSNPLTRAFQILFGESKMEAQGRAEISQLNTLWESL